MRRKLERPLLPILAVALTLIPTASPSSAAPKSSAKEDEVSIGKRVFERNTCEGCHPGGGNSLNPGRPIKGEKFQRRYKDDYVLEQVIRHGFPTAGMPKFPKTSVTDKEMKALICYIRSLTPSSASSATPASTATPTLQK